MKKIYFFFWFTIFCIPLFAAEYYWVGSGSNANYNTLLNWRLNSVTGATPTVVPGANDNVYFTDDATNTTVNFNQSSIIFNNFTVSAQLKNYVFNMNAANSATKTLTINGVTNLTNKAKFTTNASSSGSINYVGKIVFNNNCNFDNNQFDNYIEFSKAGQNIKVTGNFTAGAIRIANGVNLDLSNNLITVERGNVFPTARGEFIIQDSNTTVNLSNTTLDTNELWIKDLNYSSSSFSNSIIKIHGGAYSQTNLLTSTTHTTYHTGLIVEKLNLTLPQVIIENSRNKPYNSTTIGARGATVDTPLNLTINNLTIKETNVFFDTSNLIVNNLTIDKGYEYYFLGKSTTTLPSTFPNLKVNTINFNSLSSGTTYFKSYKTSLDTTLAYLDIPVTSQPNYSDIVANNIYSKQLVTFNNSIEEGLTKNINFTPPVNTNYYWGGKGDGISWEDIANWSSTANSQTNVASLPTSFDNVFFNSNSVVNGNITYKKLVEIHDFIVQPGATAFKIFQDNSIIFNITGSLQLQANSNLQIKSLNFTPTSKDVNNPETITQNGGTIGNSPGFDIGYRININGNGVLSIRGDNFVYKSHNSSSLTTINFNGGTLIFDVAKVDIENFWTVIENNSIFSTDLRLKNALIDVSSWTYTNSNGSGNKLKLDAGTSTLRLRSNFIASDISYVNALSHENRLTYNKIIVGYNVADINISNSISGAFNVKDIDFQNSVSISGGNNLSLTNYNTFEILRIKRGIEISMSYNANIYLRDKILFENSTCQLITKILSTNTSNSYNGNIKISSSLTDNSGVPNQIIFNNFVINSIRFDRPVNYNIVINGEIDENTIGYTTVSQAPSTTFYWIGSSNSTNWDDAQNWTTNPSGIPDGNTCAPTRFDNAHFKPFSANYSNTITYTNIEIKDLIFHSNAPSGMIINGPVTSKITASGSIHFKNNKISRFTNLILNGKSSDAVYDPRLDPNNSQYNASYNPTTDPNRLVRHQVISNGTEYTINNISLGVDSYYKFVDNFINTLQNNVGLSLKQDADLDASSIQLRLSLIVDEGRAKLNVANSTLRLKGGLNIDSDASTLIAGNTIFNLEAYTNDVVFNYNGANSNTILSTSELNYLSSIPKIEIIEINSKNGLTFNKITTRSSEVLVKTNLTAKDYTSFSNKIIITNGKELKITENAYLSGSACDITRSIVSSVNGTRAKLSILGNNHNFDYLLVKDIDAEASALPLIFGTYSTNGGNNTQKVQFLNTNQDNSTYGFGAVYTCRDINVDKMLSADGFYPTSITTFKWYKIAGNNANLTTVISTNKDIDLSVFGYGTYKLEINYDPSTPGSCIITDQINITPTPTKPVELLNEKFCKNKIVTLADIKIPGSTINWYSSVNSTTPLSPSTVIVSGNTYFAARQYDGGNGMTCESTERLELQIRLDNCGGVYINPVLRMRNN